MDINNLNDLQTLFGPRPLNAINPIQKLPFKWTTTHTVLAIGVGTLALIGAYTIVKTISSFKEPNNENRRPELGA